MLPHQSQVRAASESSARLLASLNAWVDRGELELPVLPDAAAQVLEICNDASCDARKLAAVLQRDPALASHVMRVANSPAFAPREPIVSLQHAVSRLGFAALCQIAIAVALQAKIFRVPGHEPRLRRIWTHSALAAAYAKEIARVRRANVEGAFLSGLLHDVGKPIVLQAALDVAKTRDAAIDDVVLEAAMDALHERVGGALVEQWKLPAWMRATLAHHHDPSKAAEHADEARTTCLADLLAHWAIDADADAASRLRQISVVRELHLYDDDWRALIDARDKMLRVAESYS